MAHSDVFSDSIYRVLANELLTGMLVDGYWGSGKTFAVNQATKRYQNDTKQTVIHASLYDVNSVSEMEAATVMAQFGSAETTELQQKVLDIASKFSGLLNDRIPAAASALATKDAVVVLDDLERRGPNLRLESVLSFSSRLQETQNCKVIIVCNISQLKPSDAETLRKQSDKCIQKTLKIERDTSDLINIALGSEKKLPSQATEELSKFSIGNIRLLRIIIERCLEILEAVDDTREEAQVFCVKQCTILSLCHAEIEGWPALSAILDDRSVYGAIGSVVSQDASSYPILEKHNYHYTTEFERALGEGIIRGWFDKSKLKKGLEANVPIDARVKTPVGLAWHNFHHSLAPNDDEFIQTMYDAQIEWADQIDLSNFNGALRLLSDLKKDDLIPKLIDNYLSKNSGKETEFFDITSHEMIFLKDPNKLLVSKMEEEFAARSRQITTESILDKLEQGKWHDRSIEIKILSLGAEKLAKILLHTPRDARGIIQSLRYMEGSPRSANPNEIKELIEDVFKRLSNSSLLNTLRMKSF